MIGIIDSSCLCFCLCPTLCYELACPQPHFSLATTVNQRRGKSVLSGTISASPSESNNAIQSTVSILNSYEYCFLDNPSTGVSTASLSSTFSSPSSPHASLHSRPRKLYGAVPHDMGSPSEAPWHKPNV